MTTNVNAAADVSLELRAQQSLVNRALSTILERSGALEKFVAEGPVSPKVG